MKRMSVIHEFVEFIPEELKEGILYISINYATASHLCCCGCGNRVVTPITPDDWKLIFDGVSVSLHPSIGNWNFPCRSHYWIKGDQVRWDRKWDKEEVRAVRTAQSEEKKTLDKTNAEKRNKSEDLKGKQTFGQRVTSWLKGK
jgi:hypothetical protein